MSEINSISILGCGWYGFPLAKKLLEKGYKVKGSTTTSGKLKIFEEVGIIPFKLDLNSEFDQYNPEFFKCDLLIISIPPKRSAGETDEYPIKIDRLKKALLQSAVKHVIFISSTSVYGDNNEEVNEETQPQPDTKSSGVVLKAENILKDQNIFSLTILRFAGLIGPNRLPGNFFRNKANIANGKAPVNLIHQDDCIGVTLSIIDKQAFGYIFNAASVSHPQKMDYYPAQAIKLGIDPPIFIPELTTWKIVATKNAEQILNYTFKEL
jgi:nucleoside-diphosphate-sugar epimerase